MTVPEPSDTRWRDVAGHLHSVESAGAVDGPGVRFVTFLAGCPLRCLYCHNPDARTARHAQLTTAGAVIDDVARYAPFLLRAGGGLTVSGGEPLLQPHFTTALLQGARSHGIHTVLDTSGYSAEPPPDALLAATDLVLLDIKAWVPAHYRLITGVDLAPTLALARRLAKRGTPVWLRYVLVPGLSDDTADVDGVAAFAASLGNVERVDVLPFHQMGMAKWEQLGLTYALRDTLPPSAELLAETVGRFARHGLQAA